MKTFDDILNHPLAPLFRASFDTSDLAYALEIPSFTDWRKNADREGFFHLPRRDENPVRPRYRYAHAVEYALFRELSKGVSKSDASMVLLAYIREWSFGFRRRLQDLDDEAREIVRNNATLGGDDFSLQPNERATLLSGSIVDFPAIGFDPAVLDRSEERKANPLFWVLAPGMGGSPVGRYVECEGRQGLAEALKVLTQTRQEAAFDPDDISTYRLAQMLNVTGTLMDLEERLKIRLRGKQLRGGDD